MNWGWLALNAAYLIYAVSGVFKDMLRLRLTLLVATVLFIGYGIIADIWSVVWWNIPVACVHTWQIMQLIRQRRGIDLDAEAEAIRTLLYPDLDRTHFNQLWHASNERIASDEILIERDKPVDELCLILEGEVDVHVKPDLVVRLGRLRIIGEMSSITGKNATATVQAVGTVRLRAWSASRFAELLRESPEIERAHLRAVGSELARKLT